MTLQKDINKLKPYFLSKDGGIMSGEVTPGTTDTHDLGRSDKRWDTIYCKTLVAEEGGGGGEGGDADTVDGFHAAGNPIPENLLALDPQSTYPISVYPSALLKDGSRALEGNLAVVSGATIDGVDIGEHTHTGIGDEGEAIVHADLTGLDADDHPQYTQRAQDEIVTGDWMFTHLQDRSAGWQFLPSDKVFKAIPHNMIFAADINKASISLGVLTSSEYAILIYDDDTPETFIKIGRGDDSITLHGTDPTYKLWAGDEVAADAPFHVKNDGSIFATAGDIAGWEFDTTTIFKNDMVINAIGRIIAGTGNEIVQLDAADPTWRLWAGHATASVAPFRVNKVGQMYMYDAFVTGTLKSTNFISGQSGFSLDSSGLAEFDQIIARGRLEATVFAEAAISVASGKMIMSDGAVVAVDIADTDDFIIVDADVFQANDIIRLKPDAYRDEWMRITSPYTIVGGKFKYYVARGLNSAEPTWDGPYDYYAGESVVRLGSAVQANVGFPLSSGEAGGEYGEYQTGGSGASTGGGYLILEGSRNFGPFFGVVARYGPVYNQLLDVVRIGNLNGILDYTYEEWGAFFGDDNQYFSYDQTEGMRIEFSGADVDSTIDKSGIKSEIFRFAKVSSDPDYINYEALVWFVKESGILKLKARAKDDEIETEFSITGVGVLSEIPNETPNGTITLFSVDNPYTPDSISVFVQGVAQRPGIDFTETNPLSGTFTMTTAPVTGVSMLVVYATNSAIDFGSTASDHGALDGLDDDDHGHYHTDTRGDARYYTKTLTDTWRNSVTQTEMGYLAGVASDVQTQITANTTPTEVEAIITAELVDGQSIDLAIDSLILTHKNIASAHHAKYTDTEVESVITAEIVGGQSIDNAIDALILTHKNITGAHHSRYADSEVESVITAELVDGQSIDLAIDSLILTHKNIASAHHAKYTDAAALAQAQTRILNGVYPTGWDADNTHAPSRNVLYDKISSMDTLIAANTTVTEVEAVITAEIVGGESIDNAIDALILTHKNLGSAHHTKYTDSEALAQAQTRIQDTAYPTGWDADTTHAPSQNAVYDKINAMDTLIAANTTVTEVEAVITAELVNGQSIDLAIDSLILTHKNITGAHHSRYADSEVEDVITAEIVGGESIDNAIDALISTHVGLSDPHTGYLLATGSRQLDGDLTFTGPQAIKTTTGDLMLDPASALWLKGGGTKIPANPSVPYLLSFVSTVDAWLAAGISVLPQGSSPNRYGIIKLSPYDEGSGEGYVDVESDLSVDGDIAVGGMVDGIDIAALYAGAVKHTLADAVNDFLVASGANTFVKKTLAQAGAILEGDMQHDNLQGFESNEHFTEGSISHANITAGSGGDHSKVTANETAIALRALKASPTFTGSVTIPETHQTSDPDKFLCTAAGVIKYRTGAELLDDIGAGEGNGGTDVLEVQVFM